MKRSEMIERLVANVLTIDGFITYSSGADPLPRDFDEIAGTIIDYLVEQGMSPPFSPYLYYSTWRNGGKGREWEEE